MATLEGNVTENVYTQPPDYPADATIVSASVITNTAKSAAIEAAGGASVFSKTVVGTVGALPFVAIDICRKVDSGDDLLEASFTSLASTGLGIAATIAIAGLAPGSIPVLVVAGIFGGLVSYFSDKYVFDYLMSYISHQLRIFV